MHIELLVPNLLYIRNMITKSNQDHLVDSDDVTHHPHISEYHVVVQTLHHVEIEVDAVEVL